MRSMSLVTRFSLVLSLAMGALAQTQSAQCLPGWEWNRNSLDQDPCTVGSMLDALCRHQIEYTYQELERNEYYVPPAKNHTGDMDCDCNTVMYSLTMACTTCQEAITYGWPTWEIACEKVYVTVYPGDIPQDTRVPLWAFYDFTVLSGGNYNDAVAKSIGRDPEAMPADLFTSTISAEPSATSTVDDTSSSGGDKTGAIVGGVVGGVCLLIITPIIVYFVVRRSHRNREKNTLPSYQRQERPVSQWETRPTSLTSDPSISTGPTLGSHVPPQPYNPANLSTIPPPMLWDQTNQFPHQSPITYVTPFSNYGARR